MRTTRPQTWQLQDAKNQLSDVVEQALHKGPQIITRRGVDTAVVLSFKEWVRLAKRRTPLVDLLRQAPRVKGGIDVTRSKDTGRDFRF